jgi:hypothetical protein
MISFPMQNNTNFGIGPYGRDQDVLNFQPVIPFHLTKKWNLITRTILPVVWQPDASQPTGQGWYGLGDLNPSLFFSPAKSGKLIWGVGPALVFPTATAPQLGQGKVSAGPGVVALTTPGHWVIGALANNVWSFAGTGSRPPVNQFLLQYFINYKHEGGLVRHHGAHHHRRLARQQRQPIEDAFRRRFRPNHEDRLPAHEPPAPVLW